MNILIRKTEDIEDKRFLNEKQNTCEEDKKNSDGNKQEKLHTTYKIIFCLFGFGFDKREDEEEEETYTWTFFFVYRNKRKGKNKTKQKTRQVIRTLLIN